MTRRAARPDASPLALSGSSVSLPVPDALLDLVAERVAALVLDRLGSTAAPSSPWLDVDEAASHLRCGKRRVYDLVGAERIPVHREGSRLLFHRGELDAWVSSGESAGNALAEAQNPAQTQGSEGEPRTLTPHVRSAA